MTYCVKWIWFILLNFAKNKEVSKRNQSVRLEPVSLNCTRKHSKSISWDTWKIGNMLLV